MYIPRTIEPEVRKWLFKGKVVIIYGARQTGKSTIVKKILADYPSESRYFNGDDLETKRLFDEAGDAPILGNLVGNNKIIVIDEAQKIGDIGLKLKILVDNFPERQIIATGSSSFDLANRLSEPLTGRNIQFTLYPLSIRELAQIWDKREIRVQLENLMIYGSYPAVIIASSTEEKKQILKQLVSDYLYKDILSFDRVKRSEVLKKFTEAISLQTGREVSYNELSNLLQIGKQTAMSYLDILEQGFILFRLISFSRNLRKEISRSRKVYFNDTGIRNALISNLNPLSVRNDKGELWENFIISEIKKKQNNIIDTHLLYFWRTYDQQEIDLVENYDGKIFATEIKWQKIRKNPPKAWMDAYKNSSWTSITKDNFLEIL